MAILIQSFNRRAINISEHFQAEHKLIAGYNTAYMLDYLRMDASHTLLSSRVGLRAACIPLYAICCLGHRTMVWQIADVNAPACNPARDRLSLGHGVNEKKKQKQS